MRVVERNGRLWLEHDQPSDPYYRHGPQPTNVTVGPPRERRDRELYQATTDFIALLDKPEVTTAMEYCKKAVEGLSS